MMRAAPLVNRIERLVRQITNERRGLLDLAGLSSLQLTVPGCRSGLPRTVTLLYVPDGDNTYLLVGSNWGRPEHPQWTANLNAATEVTIRSDGEEFPARVRQLSGAERKRAWERAVAYWPGYLMEQQLAGSRAFRLFELIRR
jgi:deazaflavin-dependent oxidoreductase (nitroreductase family)